MTNSPNFARQSKTTLTPSWKTTFKKWKTRCIPTLNTCTVTFKNWRTLLIFRARYFLMTLPPRCLRKLLYYFLILSSLFFSVATQVDVNYDIYAPVNLSHLIFTFDEILNGLSFMNTIGPGIDGIPNSFLRQCRSSLARLLLLLFNKFIDAGIFTESWKSSLVNPNHKGNNDRIV